MAVYLSPGIFPREIDLSVLPASIGPMRPAFIGAAKKGPMNVIRLVTSPQQAIDEYGEPFSDSYLMYAILAYMEEGNAAYIMRIGVEQETGQADALADVAIDTSGAKTAGWGRLPVFTGIDYGRINLRAISADEPVVFHAASTGNIQYNDAAVSTTDGATTATLGLTGTYTGAIDDTFILTILSDPDLSGGATVGGAQFEVVRNSDGEVVASGTLDDDAADGISNYVSIGDGLSIRIEITSGVLEANDSFTFDVHPDNRSFKVSVENGTATTYTFAAHTYTTVASFVDALNALLSGEDYLAVSYTQEDETVIPQLRTQDAGEWLQLTGTKAWALELGQQQYAWDIPRAYLLGTAEETYNISSQSNRVALNVVSDTETKAIVFSLPTGTLQTAAALAAAADPAGTVNGTEYFEAFTLTLPDGDEHLVLAATANNKTSTLAFLANYSNIKTLRFAEEVGIEYPYRRSYRGFNDNRLTLPDESEADPSVPQACADSPAGDECASDSAYYANVVGWLVAPSPGTWGNDLRITLSLFTDGVGDSAGRYKLTIATSGGTILDTLLDVSFDPTATRYIGNLVNPGSKFGGTNGNAYINWEARPASLGNDPDDATTFEVRQPSQFSDKAMSGGLNGIPADPAYSSELDAAVIGNPAAGSGLYAFQNPETVDINLLCTPGFSSGAVIGTALQVCESRGDVLYLVDPPFGLRPQQVVDWHNGMLLSDLAAAINSSYGALYWSWVKIYDQFAGEEIWIPPSGHVAAIYSRTARVAEPWSAPAGVRRGRILTARDVEYSPTEGERNLLYGSGNAVNPLVKFPQQGITIWGQRTLQRSDTALDRVDVRMLLTAVKKAVLDPLRSFIFEPNDSVLWRQVKATLDPVLADIQSRRGLQAYKLVVDETNNTTQRIQNHELWVSIFLKPESVVEFVVLNLAVLKTSLSFSAEEVLAAGGIVNAATSV